MRLPFFVWAQFVTSFLLLLAFPPLEAAGVLQLMDRLAGTSFFLPSGLVVSGKPLHDRRRRQPAALAAPVLVPRAPEVYVLILPAMGIVAEIIANNTRKPLWGYRSLVYSVIFLGFMSFIVWAHHMFMTGMGTTMSAFFQTTTMIISIPSVVILTALLLSLWGGVDPLHDADAVRAGVPADVRHRRADGLPLGLAPSDIHLHDTYYVIGHFHYVVAPGTIFALFAGIYYWFPKATGRKMNEHARQDPLLGLVRLHQRRLHADVHPGAGRREPPACTTAACSTRTTPALLKWNVVIGMAAWTLGLFQIPFIINSSASIKWGATVEHEPVGGDDARVGGAVAARHGNFLTEPDRVPRAVRVQRAGRGARTSRRSSSRRRHSRWT